MHYKFFLISDFLKIQCYHCILHNSNGVTVAGKEPDTFVNFVCCFEKHQELAQIQSLVLLTNLAGKI